MGARMAYRAGAMGLFMRAHSVYESSLISPGGGGQPSHTTSAHVWRPLSTPPPLGPVRLQHRPFLMPLFTRVLSREILRSPYPTS